ncbi:MAG: sigma-70 family RNA polymerase sigma factor [Pirellulaceae bacterium]|nr:sigma-70 family RNA polymerase sigma factor [Pirellulaceae bacterium]
MENRNGHVDTDGGLERNAHRDTRASLFDRLRNTSNRSQFEAAWQEFQQKYAGSMYGWCRRLGLSREDAQDLLQDLFVHLLRQLKTFEYNPALRFRSWLKRVTRNAAIDIFKKNSRRRLTSGALLHEVVTMDQVWEQLDRAFETEVVREARERVSRQLATSDVGVRYWEIFVATTDRGEATVEVAERWGIKVHQVYVARNRVLQLLKQTVAELTGDEQDRQHDEPGPQRC